MPVYRKRLHLTHKIDLVTCRTLDFSEIGPFKLRYLFYTQTLPRGLLKIFVVQFLFLQQFFSSGGSHSCSIVFYISIKSYNCFSFWVSLILLNPYLPNYYLCTIWPKSHSWLTKKGQSQFLSFYVQSSSSSSYLVFLPSFWPSIIIGTNITQKQQINYSTLLIPMRFTPAFLNPSAPDCCCIILILIHMPLLLLLLL